jgi:2-phosphosulfolactate phosphatase
MEWGERGAEAIGPGADFAVVVDVLRFTTALTVAADSGIEVFPYPWRDETAAEFAARNGAVLAATERPAKPSDGGSVPVSLSPVSIGAATGITRLVLPSPNGSAVAFGLANAGPTVIGACPRNRTAVARWLAAAQPTAIAVVAAGERWADGSLRPAVEDLWGAGSVVAALAAAGLSGFSQEALVAAAAFAEVQADLHTALLACASGAELAAKGLAADIAIAAELDSSAAVPVLGDGRFVDASGVSAGRHSAVRALPGCAASETVRR